MYQSVKRFLRNLIKDQSKHISIVDVLYDFSSKRAIPEIKLEEKKGLSLPIRIDIDGVWAVQHTCPNCSNKAWLGRNELIYELPEILQIHQPHFTRFLKLSTMYFDLKILKYIKKCFKNLELRENEKEFYLYSNRCEDSLSLLYHNCSVCQADFLSTYEIGYGTMSYNDSEGRTVNKIYLEEIVMAQISDKQELFKSLIVPNASKRVKPKSFK